MHWFNDIKQVGVRTCGLMTARAYYRYLRNHGWHVNLGPPFSSLASAYQYSRVYKVLSRYDIGDEVLDWGCGCGHFSRYLTANNIRTVGFSFDCLPRSLECESLFHHVHGDISDPVNLPFCDGRFSTVFSIGVLEHVWETGGSDIASMREIWRVLRPSGLFICAHLPNLHGWIEKFASAIGMADHFHKRKYISTDVYELARNAGFSIEEIGRYNFLPRNKLSKLPKVICDTMLGASFINGVDFLLASCAPRYTQNYYFVARKIEMA